MRDRIITIARCHNEMGKEIRRIFLRRINHITNVIQRENDYQKIWYLAFRIFISTISFLLEEWKWIIDYPIPFFLSNVLKTLWKFIHILFDSRSIYHPAEKITSVKKNTRRLLKHRGKVVKNSAKIVLVCQCCPRSLLIEGFMTRMLSWKLSLEIRGETFQT